ncbi:MAG: CDP-4-keto-6-deoxy-D-glucose-3-dehydrase [Candidatus Omnitrophica bacterium CG11_big_fil_rev_8_21_14_0_20_45_26]|uniref:CDP-4-keto-6-deoxy-D-glucose-3-dehydrase n=1 Tax=Candidatus Abzuiibacterium crystallinum TaxID=1974748 RepID=A0A2H0LR94_9BACT|nr:MAG: CDP-4-keto-6-deoxy-D-glucose-3-dehydrase [Candidatus Omnitrophica bacterium CG11_big_fil_rev_8_21_14_0_20_45_26]PIW64716.1 MAG: CDP-4-keto-6-deoxy-D-glucose-3-dehydrase [Candidatus Omnitrophica bacterium CG12_big_fil_rev_8_21_14_0_65_45_16]
MNNKLHWPLMHNNITAGDRQELIDFLKEDNILTQSRNVLAFEEAWSRWLGVKHSVFVNSGSSANLVTLAAFQALHGTGEVLVPTLTWVSDITAVIRLGFDPIFVDINPRTLGMDENQIKKKVTKKTKAVFLTHILGYNALTDSLLAFLAEKNIPLVEDVCESYGATHCTKKLGTFGLVSNFSFYYAHHLTTIEGGMVSTNNKAIYETVRMLRSHGLVRESTDSDLKRQYESEYSDLNPEFIFAYPGFNIRSTELNAVMGLSHLKRLDEEIKLRNRNLAFFLANLDPKRYFVDFELEGCSNYAFTLVLKEPNHAFCERVMETLKDSGVEFRRGTSGGGNQLRQPYLKPYLKKINYKDFPNVEHVHFFGFYIGNYPSLSEERISKLCQLLNQIPLS